MVIISDYRDGSILNGRNKSVRFSDRDTRSRSISPGRAISPIRGIGYYQVSKLNSHCSACKGTISDSLEIVALGRRWHKEHFVCNYCKCQLSPAKFCDKNGQPYCEKDYNFLFRPKCISCYKPVIETPVIALANIWHLLCFTCTECDKQLNPNRFFENRGKPYCEDDYHKLFSPKCFACSEPIKYGKVTKALGHLYHPEHFSCTVCKKQLFSSTFREVNGKAYCDDDYHKFFSPRCASCKDPIKESPLLALHKKWHVEHFCCTHCSRKLNPNNFFEKYGKPYCKLDWLNLFGTKCNVCKDPIENEAIFALRKHWHPHCFTCKDCKTVLDEKSFHEYDREPYCRQHFHARICPDCIKIRRAQDGYWGRSRTLAFAHKHDEEKRPLSSQSWRSSSYDRSFVLNRPGSSLF